MAADGGPEPLVAAGALRSTARKVGMVSSVGPSRQAIQPVAADGVSPVAEGAGAGPVGPAGPGPAGGPEAGREGGVGPPGPRRTRSGDRSRPHHAGGAGRCSQARRRGWGRAAPRRAASRRGWGRAARGAGRTDRFLRADGSARWRRRRASDRRGGRQDDPGAGSRRWLPPSARRGRRGRGERRRDRSGGGRRGRRTRRGRERGPDGRGLGVGVSTARSPGLGPRTLSGPGGRRGGDDADAPAGSAAPAWRRTGRWRGGRGRLEGGQFGVERRGWRGRAGRLPDQPGWRASPGDRPRGARAGRREAGRPATRAEPEHPPEQAARAEPAGPAGGTVPAEGPIPGGRPAGAGGSVAAEGTSGADRRRRGSGRRGRGHGHPGGCAGGARTSGDRAGGRRPPRAGGAGGSWLVDRWQRTGAPAHGGGGAGTWRSAPHWGHADSPGTVLRPAGAGPGVLRHGWSIGRETPGQNSTRMDSAGEVVTIWVGEIPDVRVRTRSDHGNHRTRPRALQARLERREDDYVFKPKKGISEDDRPRDVLDQERAGMDGEFRLKACGRLLAKPMLPWFAARCPSSTSTTSTTTSARRQAGRCVG